MNGYDLRMCKGARENYLTEDKLIYWENCLMKILVEILFVSTALKGTSWFIRSCNSFGSVGEIKKEF